MRYNDERDDGDHYYTLAEVSRNNCCQGACEFHGQLWCKTHNRPCSEYCYPDKRKTYLSPEKAIEQAKRILPIVEAEIAGGETRSIFYDIRKMCWKVLDETVMTEDEIAWVRAQR